MTQALVTASNELQGRAAYDSVFKNGTVDLGGSDSGYTAGIILSGPVCIISLPTVARSTMSR